MTSLDRADERDRVGVLLRLSPLMYLQGLIGGLEHSPFDIFLCVSAEAGA